MYCFSLYKVILMFLVYDSYSIKMLCTAYIATTVTVYVSGYIKRKKLTLFRLLKTHSFEKECSDSFLANMCLRTEAQYTMYLAGMHHISVSLIFIIIFQLHAHLSSVCIFY